MVRRGGRVTMCVGEWASECSRVKQHGCAQWDGAARTGRLGADHHGRVIDQIEDFALASICIPAN